MVWGGNCPVPLPSEPPSMLGSLAAAIKGIAQVPSNGVAIMHQRIAHPGVSIEVSEFITGSIGDLRSKPITLPGDLGCPGVILLDWIHIISQMLY